MRRKPPLWWRALIEVVWTLVFTAFFVAVVAVPYGMWAGWLWAWVVFAGLVTSAGAWVVKGAWHVR